MHVIDVLIDICLIVILGISYFGFGGWTLVLNVTIIGAKLWTLMLQSQKLLRKLRISSTTRYPSPWT